MPITPHGGELIDRILTGDALKAAQERAVGLTKIVVNTYTSFDIDGIAKGIFSPLKGFMNEEQTRNVLDKMHLADGVPWTIPILLAVSKEEASKLATGEEVAIEDDEGDIVAILHLSEMFKMDHKAVSYTHLTLPTN